MPTSKAQLGFGCSPLLGRVGRKDSWKALTAAFDAGITFYDTARSYGYGEGEGLVGEFFQGKRDQITISTKFGIVSAKQGLVKRVAKPVIRSILKLAPSLRGLVRGQVNAQFQSPGFTASLLHASVEESLRQLKTDYIDILFMHEAPADALENQELLDALRKLIAAGKLRMSGVSSTPEVLSAALDRQTGILTAMQFACNVFDLSMADRTVSAAESGILFVANHPFGGVTRVVQTRERLQAIAALPDTPAEIRRKLADITDAVLADVVLNVITRSTGIPVVVPSMMKAEHLKTNLAALNQSSFSDSEISWLRASLANAPALAAAKRSVGSHS